MKIHRAIETIESLSPLAVKKSERKVVASLLKLLAGLDRRQLPAEQESRVEAALEQILFAGDAPAGIKALKCNRDRFMTFLRKELSLVPRDYYLELGACFGAALGVVIGGVLEGSLGSSFSMGLGIALGVAIGAAFGQRMDHDALEQDRVLRT